MLASLLSGGVDELTDVEPPKDTDGVSEHCQSAPWQLPIFAAGRVAWLTMGDNLRAARKALSLN